MSGSLTVNERDIWLSRIKKSTFSEQPIRLVIVPFETGFSLLTETFTGTFVGLKRPFT